MTRSMNPLCQTCDILSESRVDDLRDVCKCMGVSGSGRKTDIIRRIVYYCPCKYTSDATPLRKSRTHEMMNWLKKLRDV